MEQLTVLVVEDEEAFIDALMIGLPKEGFTVEVARDGAEALSRFDEIDPDLVLLDLMLPRVSGLDVCRELRTRTEVPIIMVTAKSGEVDTVVGLEIGADDYVTKPYRIRELVARMRAVVRRSAPTPVAAGGASADAPEVEPAIVVGDVSVDQARHEVEVRGERIDLPLKEFSLLSYLMNNAGRVVTREILIDRIWGSDYVGDTKTLDVHIKRLRSKIEDDPANPTRIVTIRGLGYKYQQVSGG
ncbi:MAG: response regulator transcription factor [Actinomycetota bacterium]